MWGPINAMSVVQEVGAQKGLLSREKLEEYIRTAPPEYKLLSLESYLSDKTVSRSIAAANASATGLLPKAVS
jgi:hypothetical protein